MIIVNKTKSPIKRALGFIILIICFSMELLSCTHNTNKKESGFDVYVRQPEDVKELNKVESLLKVTPEKAALHPEYQTLEKVAVPYVPEYRIGPGDVVEIVYHIQYIRTPESYRLEVQDKVSLNFPYNPQFNCTTLVRTDGKITVPIIGDVEAESKTPEELAKILNKGYSNYLNNPSITVSLEAFNVKIDELKKAITTAPRGQSKIAPVTSDGRLSFPIIGGLQAEGFTLAQLEKIVNAKYLKHVRNLNATLILLEIHHSKFYIIGEVERPGSYEFKSRMNLIDAIAAAQGYKKSAYLKEVVVFRNDGLERPIAFKVDAGSILKNGATYANVWLKPADIIYVPKSRLDNLNDLIEKVFTKGIYAVLPFDTYFSWGEKDLGGDGGNSIQR